jgi:metal-responsive CopG/Arc/MetJ family transcriptional regulator|tara:strand:+ start:550 stop:810 length:261 start_codon:yes stop_codon:yes gene_type:complete
MEPLTIRFEDSLLHQISKIMKKHHYATKTEFIREAIREYIKELEKEEALARVRKLYGASKRKTTDEQLEKAREASFEELKKELNLQ